MNILLSEKQIVHYEGYFKPQTGMKHRDMMLRDAHKVKMRKVFPFTVIGYFNGGFQMTEDWLKVIILHHLRKMN